MRNAFFNKIKIPIIRHILEGRFIFLLASILAYLAIVPLFEGFRGIRNLLDIFLTAVIIAGIYAVSPERRNRIFAALLAVPMFASIWIYRWFPSSFLVFTFHLFYILFIVYSIAVLLAFVFKTESITRDVIYAAVVGYLFIGLLFADFYAIFELIRPGSFSFSQDYGNPAPFDFTFYSFVTLTTLGYGDITPLTGKAKSFSMLEALIGQLYLTILIARLVGMHISRKTKDK